MEPNLGPYSKLLRRYCNSRFTIHDENLQNRRVDSFTVETVQCFRFLALSLPSVGELSMQQDNLSK